MMRPVNRLVLHVSQRVVHPAHVPFHAEAESARVDRPADSAPRGRFLGDRQDAGELAVESRVHVFEELDRFQVLASTEDVRKPLAVIARVIQVQHRRDRIHANAVDVIHVEPEPRTRQQEVADLEAAVVEDVRAPIGMLAESRIGVLVAACPVEAAERVSIHREVSRHPIDQHADAVLMAVIDEVHEVMRRPEPTGRCEVAGALIAPTSIEGMLGDGHQLQVRVTHLVTVLDQHVSQFAITEVRPIRLRRPPPTGEMDFVGRDRLLEPVGRFSPLAPVGVMPFKVAKVINDRRRLRPHLAGEGIRV